MDWKRKALYQDYSSGLERKIKKLPNRNGEGKNQTDDPSHSPFPRDGTTQK